MKKKIKDLDLWVTSEKLENGLEIYIIPRTDVNNTYATYSTRYGGLHNEFVPINGKKMQSYPKGIAHFLEHKMFESEDGTDVFGFFSERGSDANANTGSRKTTYLFSGPNDFYENLEFLLNYVESPYFTDANVKKEKGIIEQEIQMYRDKPYSRLYEGILYNAFINHPQKFPVIGTIKSVRSITKDDLYDCYNTFYHPSNMFIVVTGNVDPDQVLEIIKTHEDKRKLEEAKPIKLKEYEEPNEVAKKAEVIEMPITIPKLALAYKISYEDINGLKPYEIYHIIMTAFDLKVGNTSLFSEQLRNEELITESLGVTGIKTDKHILVIIDAETKCPEKVIEAIKNEVKTLKINKEDFERRKKVSISGLLTTSDNIFSTNDWLMGDLIDKKEVMYNPVEQIKKINMDMVNKVLNKRDLSNTTSYIINPESK